jgi:hypothetical protein
MVGSQLPASLSGTVVRQFVYPVDTETAEAPNLRRYKLANSGAIDFRRHSEHNASEPPYSYIDRKANRQFL